MRELCRIGNGRFNANASQHAQQPRRHHVHQRILLISRKETKLNLKGETLRLRHLDSYNINTRVLSIYPFDSR